MQIIQTPIGLTVQISDEAWKLIATIKHPMMADHLDRVVAALKNPDEIRRSRSDKNVYLFYKSKASSRWVCGVTKDKQTGEGFLITAYITDKIKEGDLLWKK